MLKIADKMIAGVILPGVLLVLLMLIPYLDPNPSRRVRDRKVAIISGIVAGVVMIIWSWMGTPQYAVAGAPAVEVVQELMPEEGAGHVREMGYHHLLLGTHITLTTEEMVKQFGQEETQRLLDSGVVPYDVVETGEDAEFAELIHEYRASIIHYDESDADFNNAYGYLTITLDQPRLKRINWEINYLSGEGADDQFVRNFWLHENSMYWEQYGLRDMSYLSNGEEE
jgi:hypothetical protein